MCTCMEAYAHWKKFNNYKLRPAFSLVVQDLPTNAGDPRDVGLVPGVGNGTHSSILAWKIPWAEQPGGLLSMGSQRVGHD